MTEKPEKLIPNDSMAQAIINVVEALPQVNENAIMEVVAALG